MFKEKCPTYGAKSLMRSRASIRGDTHTRTVIFSRNAEKGVYGRDWIRIACGMTSVENLNLKYRSYVNLSIAYTFRRVNVKILNVLARWVRSYSPPNNVIAKEP